eukprot:1252821-Rhodomonas_salina.1
MMRFPPTFIPGKACSNPGIRVPVMSLKACGGPLGVIRENGKSAGLYDVSKRVPSRRYPA